MKLVKLGELLIEQKETVAAPDGRGLTILGVNNRDGIQESKHPGSADLSRYKMFRNGWFAYNPMRINVGSIGWTTDDLLTGIISPDYVVFTCNERLDAQYLWLFLKSDIGQREIRKYTTGTVRERLYFTSLAEISIPLPPIDVQRKLARRLSSIKTEIGKIQTTVTAQKSRGLPQLRRTILQLAVQGQLVPQDPNDEPADLLRQKLKKARRKYWEELEVAKMEVKGVKPKGDEWKQRLADVTPFQADDAPRLPGNWKWVRVAEVGEVQLGRQRAPRYHNGPNMRPYLRVQNVYEDRIDVSDLNYMDFSPVDFVVFHLRHGDLLLNEGQSFKLVGRPAIYRDEVPGACFQNTLIRFRPYRPLKPEFALLVFRAYMHSGKFQSLAQQTTNIAHLSAGRFADLEFPLPPLAEQKRIVSKVTELMSLCDALEAKLTQAEAASSLLLSAAVHQLLNSHPTSV